MDRSMNTSTNARTERATGTERPRGSAAPLQPLSKMDDYDIVDDEPDIRGWKVRSVDNIEIGEVKDLLVDVSSLTVRYLEVQLRTDTFGVDDDQRVLLPLGSARLNEDSDVVVVKATGSDVAALPMMSGDAADRFDDVLLERYDRGHQYDERDMDAFFGTRRFGRKESSYLRRR